MTIKVQDTQLPEVKLITPSVFGDKRGYFIESHHQKKYEELNLTTQYVQDNHSHSCQGVLRGLHYQAKKPQAKLVYVPCGEIYDVAVDIRIGSPNFGKWTGAFLSAENHQQMHIPVGFAHGFYVCSKYADIIYKCSDFYLPGDDYGIIWSDPKIAIKWPDSRPLLSAKDEINPTLANTPESRLPCF